jgi:hypothetical protein
VYPTALAAIAVPVGGVNALEMTLATHPDPAMGLRASSTCTWPKEPLMVPATTVFARVPRLPAFAGAEIDRLPPVTVMVATVVSADAG